ncbi:MAG TPA: cytochrome c [Hyphomicrobiaceae bacterium]|nr:cytochrome c [Hyphomicrobiaceae bacterium]
MFRYRSRSAPRRWTSPVTRLRRAAGSVHEVLVVATAAVVCHSTAAHADASSALAARGKAILETNCGRCHAVEVMGDSPLKIAPPMRDIYMKFPVRELEEELKEGKVSRHKEMPQISFSDDDVEAILTYLYGLAVERAP